MFWRSSANHTQRIEEAYKRAVAEALKGLPHALAAALKPPAERLCAKILSDERAYRKFPHSIGFSGRQRGPFCHGQLDPWFSVHTLSSTTQLSIK
jgi:hypothetical protein